LRYYAVIDTNVLVSAMLKWDSIPGSIMQLVFSGIVTPVLNEIILDEYRSVLQRDKFGFELSDIEAVLEEIESRAISVKEHHIDIDIPDPKDVVFYEVVMEERKTETAYLVTGNTKHFPIQPFVVTPRQFMEIILSNLRNI